LTVACGLQHELDLSGRPADIYGYFKGVPGLSRLYVVERALAIGSALVWLAVFVLLGIAELRCLVWLADGALAGYSSLAAFSVIVIAVAMAAPRSSRPPIRKRPSPHLLLPPTQRDVFHDPGLKPVNGGGPHS
jgi:hypothetical protein